MKLVFLTIGLLALAFAGIAIPYGNSDFIPFSRSYYAGGPNDNRAWSVYKLGVGATGGSKNSVTVSHSHTFSNGKTNTTGNHRHAIKRSNSDTGFGGSVGTDAVGSNFVYSEYDGDHSHTVSGTISSSGSSGTNANLPPYYALAYIMKL